MHGHMNVKKTLCMVYTITYLQKNHVSEVYNVAALL